jgi:hypothetical protein
LNYAVDSKNQYNMIDNMQDFKFSCGIHQLFIRRVFTVI